MESTIIPDSKYQQLKISFTFDEQHQDKLIIKTLLDNDSYILKLDFNPDLDFEEIKKALLQKQFKLTSITSEVLKIKIGAMYFEFHNVKNLELNALKTKVSELDQKLQEQSRKSQLFQENIKIIKVQFDLMTTKNADLARYNDEKSQEILRIKKEMAEIEYNCRQSRKETLKMKEQLENTMRFQEKSQLLNAELKRLVDKLSERQDDQERKISTLDLCEYKNGVLELKKVSEKEQAPVKQQQKPQKEMKMGLKKSEEIPNSIRQRSLRKIQKNYKILIFLGLVFFIGSVFSFRSFLKSNQISKSEPKLILDQEKTLDKNQTSNTNSSSNAAHKEQELANKKTDNLLKMENQSSNKTIEESSNRTDDNSQEEKLKLPLNYTSSARNYKFSQQFKRKQVELKRNNSIASLNWEYEQSFALVEGVLPKNAKSSIRFKIQNLGWFSLPAVGLCLKKVIEANSYELRQGFRQKILHGSFILNRLGFSFSHSNISQNYKQSSASYSEGDIIRVEFDLNELLFHNQRTKKKWKMNLNLTESQWKEVHFCALMDGSDQISILNPLVKFSAQQKSENITLINDNLTAINKNPLVKGHNPLVLVDRVLREKNSQIRFRIQQLGKHSITNQSLIIGLCLKNQVAPNSSKLNNFKTVGQGYFLLSCNGFSYYNNKQSYIKTNTGLKYGKGDIIKVETNENELWFRNEMRSWEYKMNIKLTEQEWKLASFCVNLDGDGDSVSIVNG